MSTISQLAASMDYDYSYTTTAADPAVTAGLMLLLLPVYLVILAVSIVSLWKIFTKAGRPGWAALIPLYNTWTLLEIAGKPGWWLFAGIALSFIPFIGALGVLAGAIIVSLELAKKFGKSSVFAIVGLVLFPIVGYPMLAFGDAKYESDAPLTPEKQTPEIVADSNASIDTTPKSPQE